MTAICSFCAHANPAAAKFCNECAAPLHLKPCRLCDAVNARDEQTCFRCGAVLPAAPAMAAASSPERIVAQADATLATLQRELDAATAVPAGMPPTSIHDGAAGAISPSRLGEGVARENRLQPVVAPGDPRAPNDVPPQPATAAPGPTFGAPSLTVAPEDRQRRHERRSRGFVLAVASALVVVPVAAYLMRNPAQLEEWLGRTPAPSRDETVRDPSQAPAAAPAAIPASPPVDSAPAALPGEPPPIAQPAQDGAASVDTAPPPTLPTDVAPAATSVGSAPAPVVGAAVPDARAKPASRAKSSTARTRPRERVTKPRPSAPAAQPP